MNFKIFETAEHELPNQIETSLSESYLQMQSDLSPPFHLKVPSASEYVHLNQALLYALLTQPSSSRAHLTHLHAIVTDGYCLFVSILVNLCSYPFHKLLDISKSQFLWITSQLISVYAVGIQSLLMSLLRQIGGGDFSSGNLLLCFELLKIFMDNWKWVSSESEVLTSSVFVYLRLLSDHYRLIDPASETLKAMEIEYCLRALRNCFNHCMTIGRDMIRLLQDLVHIPEFWVLWKDLLCHPDKFGVSDFKNIMQIYTTRTPKRYFVLRIPPDMESYLRFLLSRVKWGSQKRYQEWFASKFFCRPESETIIIDIVRFICCAHHPTNEILQSNVISRWAIVGWLLKCCKRNHIEANVKLALFYDWLFFNAKYDNIMDVEPAILLMVNSVPKYVDLTQGLLEFLFLLVDNYDIDRKGIICMGVFAALDELLKRGVVITLEPLISVNNVAPALRARLLKHLRIGKSMIKSEILSLPMLTVDEDKDCALLGCQTIVKNSSETHELITPEISVLEKMIQELKGNIEKSGEKALCTLQKLLLTISGLNSEGHFLGNRNDLNLNPEVFADDVTQLFTLKQYELFSNKLILSDKIPSATSLIICFYIFSRSTRIESMLLYWVKRGCPVGAHILIYAARLAEESRSTDCSTDQTIHEVSKKILLYDKKLNWKDTNCRSQLVNFHFDVYMSCSAQRKCCQDINKRVATDTENMDKFIKDAFLAYEQFINYLYRYKQPSEHCSNKPILCSMLASDIRICCEHVPRISNSIFQSVFSYLPELSVCNGSLILMLVNSLDNAKFFTMQCEISLKRYSIFGENNEVIKRLVSDASEWSSVDQQKVWTFLVSELVMSPIQLDELVVDLCSSILGFKNNGVALNGILSLTRHCFPKMEIIDLVLCLPDGFEDFAASLLASWVALDFSSLIHNLAEWLEQRAKSVSSRVNCHTILQFIAYLKQEAIRSKNRALLQLKAKLCNFLLSIHDEGDVP